MVKNSWLTKILALAGTLLVWLPLLAPVFFSLVRVAGARPFSFDYLMPAELFPVVLLGGALLSWAALRAQLYRRLIPASLGLALALLVLSQALAVLTGLASGQAEPAGWPWVLVLSALAGYSLLVVVMGVGGLLLLRDLLARPPHVESHPAA